MRLLLAFVSGFMLISCSKNPNKFSDEVILKIADFQDHRFTDSLLPYFNHRNPAYRQEAALAFASVQDSAASRYLGNLLLDDADTGVKKAAAYALGQTGGVEATNALIAGLELNSPQVVAVVAEGLGKTIQKRDLESFWRWQPADTLEESGLARGIYHLGLRGLADSLWAARQAKLLRSFSFEARLAAAHFFARTNFGAAEPIEKALLASLAGAEAEVRMALVLGLREFPADSTRYLLEKILTTDPDYRVRVNTVRALRSFSWPVAQPLLLIALGDRQTNVAIAAAEVARATAQPESFDVLCRWARQAKVARVRGLLYEAALSVSNSKELTEDIIQLYQREENTYAKVALLAALSQSTTACSFLRDVLLKADLAVLRTTAAASFISINRHKQFSLDMQPLFTETYMAAVASPDGALAGMVARALADSAFGYKKLITDFSFLHAARKKLSLPRDVEAIEPLEAAIAYFENRPKAPTPKNQFNHPIDWALVKTIRQLQQVAIQTPHGEIVLRLLVNEAPGSVANFVQLASRGYFNNKFVHRVVPNFVIQTGCHRGDGFGSEDYSIRSEFSAQRYETGSVGMASAGKDTEGTQWFITHSPTPHLDGRYTIFAKVEKGMEAVYQLGVGDPIRSVTVLK